MIILAKNASTAISSLQNVSGDNVNKTAKDINTINKRPAASESKSNNPKEPISLAAFIGGRATGPVLTKPAPQVNHYDADLFDLPKHDGPHPIFGKALIRPSQAQSNARPASLLSQPKTGVASSLVSNNASIPKPTPSMRTTSLAEAVGGQGSGPRLTKSHPVKEDSEVAGVSILQGRPLPGLTKTQLVPPVPPSSKPAIPSSSRPNPSTSLGSIAVPSLARSTQPHVNISPSTAVPESPAPAPAFLRPGPTTEELHPSLTKLQGRGFVVQRVKAVTPSKESPPSETEGRTNDSPPNLRKRPSVLDRWQPALSSHTPTSAIPERTKTLEQIKTVQKPDTSPLAHKSSNDASKGIIGESKAAPIRLPGMVSGDIQRSTYKSTESNVIATSVSASPHKSTSVMANTSLNHVSRYIIPVYLRFNQKN